MGERRKRKSLWDMEDETKHLSGMREQNSWMGKDRHSSHSSGHYHEFSDARTTTTRKSRDQSGWLSWESTEEHPIAPMNSSFKNMPEGKEMAGGRRYRKSISPGFDGIELHSYSHAHEYDRSHSQRYMERGRSRSRSRSRTRGRSRSRSFSRGREREKGRGRGWSRSRSRSRSDGNANDHRSHSPIGDYRRQSYGWSDRRSGPEKSSQTCRDFASGRCRRGSQCRFFHPSNASHRDGDLVEDETPESWRSRADHSRVSKPSYTRSGLEPRHDVSDPYHGEDEQFVNRSKSSVPCKDFVRGKCRWGETCRFSHHAAPADSFGQGTRNTSFDKEFDHKQHNSGKPICKYFASGRCDRDNCRFSHEDPNLIDLHGRLDEVTDSRRSHKNSSWWDAPKWDDTARTYNALKPTGWGEAAIVTDTTSTGDIGNGQNNGRRGHPFENENKRWVIQESKSNSLKSEKHSSFPGESGSYGGDTGPAESIPEDNMPNKQERLILHGSQLQNQDEIVDLYDLNALQEEQSFSVNALQQNVYPASNIEQQHGRVIDNNQRNSFGSDVLGEVKDAGNTNHPIILSGQSLNQNDISMFPGHSSMSNESDRGQNMLGADPSNEFGTDLNVPETHVINPLNVQIHTLNNQKAVQSPGLLEAKVPQFITKLLTNKHSDQAPNSPVTAAGQQVSPEINPVSLAPRFVNEHSQTYAGVDISSSRGMLPSFTNIAVCPPLVNTTNVLPNAGDGSLDLINSMGNSSKHDEHGNHDVSQGTEQNNQLQLRISAPSGIVHEEFDGSKVKHPRQQQAVENLGLTGGTKAMGEESKGVQENKPSEALDGHRNLEEGSADKDEKGLRVFKNALIEFVKEILKPTWKEGRMSREVHKTVVKKVVDKVAGAIPVDQIPKTQDKVEQYLSVSKPKITKLVQAYVERCRKEDS